MDTRIQQVSFIPKKPLVNKGYSLTPRVKKISLLNALGAVMLLCTAGAFGGLFFWQMQVDAKTEVLRSELADNRAKIDDAAFAVYSDLDMRLKTAMELLENHTASSPLFRMINEITLLRVQLIEFAFSVTPGGAPVVTVSGVTPGFEVLYRQVQAYELSEEIQSAKITDISLNEAGNVLFSAELVFVPDAAKYESRIENLTPAVSTNNSPAVGTSTNSQ